MTTQRKRRKPGIKLLTIAFPMGAIASASHRVSGVIGLLSLPLVVKAFARSLSTEAAYESLLSTAHSPLGITILLLPCWAIAQHVLAGCRHLQMDVGVGAARPLTRRSARPVLAGATFGAAALARATCRRV